MPYTSHGHPYGVISADEPAPEMRARCGGPALCRTCKNDAGILFDFDVRTPVAEGGED